MDLSSFKLLKEDQGSYTVAHPNGKSLVVDKKGLSDKAHAVIKALSAHPGQYAEGTPDVEPVEEDPAQDQMQVEKIPDQNVVEPVNPPAEESPVIQTQTSSIQPEEDQAESSAEMENKKATPQTPSEAPVTSDLNTALDKEGAAVQGNIAAKQAAGRETAKGFGNAIADIKAMPTASDITMAQDAKDAKLTKAVIDAKVDPKHFVNNMSTLSKIGTAIGAIFGGMGAATTGGPNLAVSFLNDSINKDIMAQQNNQDKAMNLWKMNRDKTQSDVQANLLTRNQLLSVAEAQAKKAMAGTMGPEAAMRGTELLKNISMEKSSNNRMLGLLNGSDTDPVQLVSYVVPKEHQAAAIKEIGDAQYASKIEDKLLDLRDKAAGKENTWSTMKRLGREPPEIEEAMSLAEPLLRAADGRVSPESRDNFKKAMFPQFFQTQETAGNARKSLEDFIHLKKQAPTAKAYNIDINKYKSTATKQNNYQPGQVVSVKGQNYKVGPDGDSLLPI